MSAAQRAINLIDKYCIQSPAHLNLEEIANAEKIIVEETDLKSKIGEIIYGDGYGLIKVDSKIKEKGQKRFTIAHELGHFCNDPEFKNKMFACGITDLNLFKSPVRIELDANEFAGELLMHRPWFNDFVIKRKINLDIIKELAECFGVSLSAAAIRYSQIGKYPVAVILSSGGLVKWKCINEHFPFKWIPNGYRVREESAAYDYFHGREMQTCEDLIPAHAWFSEDFKCPKDLYFLEQNAAMPAYDSVLTLLWEQ